MLPDEKTQLFVAKNNDTERDRADKKFALKWTEWAWYVVITASAGAVLTALVKLVVTG